MKKLLFLGFLLAMRSQAEVIQGRIHDIDRNLVKLENGRVAFLDKFDQVRLMKNDVVRITIDDRSSVISVRPLKFPLALVDPSAGLHSVEIITPFVPTIIDSMEQAQAIFERSNPYYKRLSECSDRAHVWAHEEFRATGTKSLKVFVFFTASYINSVRFKWWFHVAPLYKVRDRDEVRDLVMDYRYTDRPMSVKDWTDGFVYSKRPCKLTTKFSEYDVNPQTEDCYLILESMHYRLRNELHLRELSGRYKIQTSESELRMSRRFAFEN
jgi:hypothetical protein